jgi:MOSC domain-containing protein YiiM
LISTRVVELLAGPREHWSLFGDQIYVDLDLSEENLPVGQRLRLGQALIEITDQPHLGCAKFAERFGAAALKFVNRKELRHLRLRGVYARVVENGEVKVGDRAIRC